ncbi:MAG: hypothetical protein IJF59_00305, partial [Clostridia bacterium]|nr:hypothetical protein [Clostridia bacterium]
MDTPTPHGYDDLPAECDALGLQKYFDGLARFIRHCPTPMTIAIQGGWGSGKTSAMKIIRRRLGTDTAASQGPPARLIHIDFNTWQYARAARGVLFIPLLLQLIERIDEVAPTVGVKFEPIDGLLGRFATVIAGGMKATFDHLADQTPLGGLRKELDSGFRSSRAGEEARKEATGFAAIVAMKQELERKIRKLVTEGHVSRLVFYIDDLDRLGPEEAVEFLEDLKNYMECEHCVFVLALDHEIVRRGLREKYGDEIRDAYAERFFDKIIQLPFNLPTNQYNIEQYLRGLLQEEGDSAAFAAVIHGFGDTNPRTIKRVFNIMRMYEGIADQPYQGHRPQLLAMLLLQTNHEELYRRLMRAIAKDLAADPLLHTRLLFGEPALPQQTAAWFDLRRFAGAPGDTDEAEEQAWRDQAVVREMAEVFGICCETAGAAGHAPLRRPVSAEDAEAVACVETAGGGGDVEAAGCAPLRRRTSAVDAGAAVCVETA